MRRRREGQLTACKLYMVCPKARSLQGYQKLSLQRWILMTRQELPVGTFSEGDENEESTHCSLEKTRIFRELAIIVERLKRLDSRKEGADNYADL